MYQYSVSDVVKVVDGDTVDLMVDLGFRTYTLQRIRLSNINTPELRGGTAESRAKAVEAKEFVKTWFEKAKTDGLSIIVTTFKDKQGKYGRYLGQIAAIDWRNDVPGLPGGHETRVLNADLLAAGLAEEYRG